MGRSGERIDGIGKTLLPLAPEPGEDWQSGREAVDDGHLGDVDHTGIAVAPYLYASGAAVAEPISLACRKARPPAQERKAGQASVLS